MHHHSIDDMLATIDISELVLHDVILNTVANIEHIFLLVY
jgi:hypothetical protein